MTQRASALLAMAAALWPAWALPAAAAVKQAAPDNRGPARLLCASPYGGKGIEEIVGAAILPDGSAVLAGNRNLTKLRKGRGQGFLLRLKLQGRQVTSPGPVNVAGHVDRMKLAPSGSICLLVDSSAVFSYRPGTWRPTKRLRVRGITDFGVDEGGELVVLHGRNMTRFDAGWSRRKWTAAWHAYGGSRPGGMAVCAKTGVAAVVGYGMTHTGREPWKDPYAYGFDRAGKQVWKLWDPRPSRQVSSRQGGNGLMADTTGKLARARGDGKVYLGLYADGGNSVCTRDPADPNRPIDPAVFAGVHQRGPGHGFKGASKTSVAFRVDAATGKIEKGTWMCAWLSPQRANGLGMDDLTADAAGRVYIVGSSASGCPTKKPWFYDATAYRGGGFLSVFDGGFGMLQSGFFQQTDVRCVAAGSGYVLIGGQTKPNPKDPDHPLQVHRPIQADLGGGEADAYFAVFETGPHAAQKPAAKSPAPAEDAAARLLKEARQALRGKRASVARAKLRYLLRAHPRSAEARQAKALLEQLAAAQPKSPSEYKDITNERRGEALLLKAEVYLRNRLRRQARQMLRQVIQKYPKTRAAKSAHALLLEHFPDSQ